MMWLICDRTDGTIAWTGSDYPSKVQVGDRGVIIPIPDQPLSIAAPEHGIPGEIILGESRYPDAIPLRYTEEEICAIRTQIIDKQTGKAIDEAIHPFASIEEQIGILRDQIVHILNALGIEPTPEFARLNEIAIKEIEAARKKKEELNAQNDSA